MGCGERGSTRVRACCAVQGGPQEQRRGDRDATRSTLDASKKQASKKQAGQASQHKLVQRTLTRMPREAMAASADTYASGTMTRAQGEATVRRPIAR